MKIFSPTTLSGNTPLSPLQGLAAAPQRATGFLTEQVHRAAAFVSRGVSSLWRAPVFRATTPSRILPVMAASAALFLGACDNGSSGNTNNDPPPYTPPTVYIDVDEIGFYPAESWAEPGARVVFTNLACDDFNYDNWCDWDEELDVEVAGETTTDSYGSDYFDTGYINYNGAVSVRLPTSLWAGDAYFLDAWYRYDSDWVGAGHATGWLNIE